MFINGSDYKESIFMLLRIISPLLLMITISLIYDKDELVNLFPYFLFSIGLFQVLLITIFWLPSIAFTSTAFSGDYITGTTGSSTHFTNLLGTTLIIYQVSLFKGQNYIKLLLLLFLFLAQSITQLIVLIISIFIIRIIYKTDNLQLFFQSLLLSVFSFILIDRFISILPYINTQTAYMLRNFQLYYTIGFYNHPKIIGLSKIFSDFSNSHLTNLLFGFGSGKFVDRFAQSPEMYFRLYGDNSFLGMGATFHTSMNMILYDYGLLVIFLFIYLYYTLGKFLLNISINRKDNLLLSGISLIIFYCATFILFPTGLSMITNFIFGTFLGIIIRMNQSDIITA